MGVPSCPGIPPHPLSPPRCPQRGPAAPLPRWCCARSPLSRGGRRWTSPKSPMSPTPRTCCSPGSLCPRVCTPWGWGGVPGWLGLFWGGWGSPLGEVGGVLDVWIPTGGVEGSPAAWVPLRNGAPHVLWGWGGLVAWVSPGFWGGWSLDAWASPPRHLGPPPGACGHVLEKLQPGDIVGVTAKTLRVNPERLLQELRPRQGPRPRCGGDGDGLGGELGVPKRVLGSPGVCVRSESALGGGGFPDFGVLGGVFQGFPRVCGVLGGVLPGFGVLWGSLHSFGVLGGVSMGLWLPEGGGYPHFGLAGRGSVNVGVPGWGVL